MFSLETKWPGGSISKSSVSQFAAIELYIGLKPSVTAWARLAKGVALFALVRITVALPGALQYKAFVIFIARLWFGAEARLR